MMEPVAWRYRWIYPKTGEVTGWATTDTEWVARQRRDEGYEVEPLVRLSDAEARIAEITKWRDEWKDMARAVREAGRR